MMIRSFQDAGTWPGEKMAYYSTVQHRCPSCSRELFMQLGRVYYSCPKCGTILRPSQVEKIAKFGRGVAALGAALVGALFGGMVSSAGSGAPGGIERPLRPWVIAGSLSLALMVWTGRSGRFRDASVWYKIAFWSLFCGGISLGVGLLGFSVQRNDRLVELIVIGMILGGLVRSVVAGATSRNYAR
jgi:predicted RNA-binding Zn-ribbon protein involved in translation (DUF1610 family)